ncbi:MAG: peptidoglycan recognition protein family protein [Actinomycetota bacterium]|nr:peptidoglycan recognition protein family protein [Actinomycetota bacterium]
MQRRTLVRALAGATLAIAAGDLAALMARSAPRSPSSSRPSLDDTMARGRPRRPPLPGQLNDRTASPLPPQAPQASARALICRDAWGALPPAGPLAAHRIERLTIHHTAVVATDPAAARDRLRNYQRYHRSRGLGDLAYHVVIDRAGNLFEGRALSAAPGTFTRYDPVGHFTACLDGNFDVQSPTRPQFEALVDLLAWAADRFGVSLATIRGHRAYVATRCPGAALHALVADDTLRRRVEERRAAGRVALVPVCGQEDGARVSSLVPGRDRRAGGGTASL